MFEWVVLFLEIMLIDLVLSGDNAVVIAMASKNLPLSQRTKAVWWGAFGAVTLRITLTIIAVSILTAPYIQAAGSAVLLWIGIKLLIDDDNHRTVKTAPTLGKAVLTIILADFVMSLDNVLAIAATARNNIPVIAMGVGLSIPIIVWGSTLVIKLLHKYPIFIYLGAGILGYTAGEMFVKDEKIQEYVLVDLQYLHWLIPVVTTMIVLFSGGLKQWSVSRVGSRVSK